MWGFWQYEPPMLFAIVRPAHDDCDTLMTCSYLAILGTAVCIYMCVCVSGENHCHMITCIFMPYNGESIFLSNLKLIYILAIGFFSETKVLCFIYIYMRAPCLLCFYHKYTFGLFTQEVRLRAERGYSEVSVGVERGRHDILHRQVWCAGLLPNTCLLGSRRHVLSL